MAAMFRQEVLAAGEGTDNMKNIALAVQEGADAYLQRQFRTLGDLRGDRVLRAARAARRRHDRADLPLGLLPRRRGLLRRGGLPRHVAGGARQPARRRGRQRARRPRAGDDGSACAPAPWSACSRSVSACSAPASWCSSSRTTPPTCSRASASAPPCSPCSCGSAAASSPRPPTSVPTWSARSSRTSPRTTRATPRRSPTTSATTSATAPAWPPTSSSRTPSRWSPR